MNDPTGIRDAALSEPALRPQGRGNRYVACVRFNAHDSSGAYVGTKTYAATFARGRFDQLTEQTREAADASRNPCADVAWQPFPELERLPR